METKPATTPQSEPEIHNHLHVHMPPPQPPLSFTSDGELRTYDQSTNAIARGFGLIGVVVLGYIFIHALFFWFVFWYLTTGLGGAILSIAIPVGLFIWWRHQKRLKVLNSKA